MFYAPPILILILILILAQSLLSQESSVSPLRLSIFTTNAP